MKSSARKGIHINETTHRQTKKSDIYKPYHHGNRNIDACYGDGDSTSAGRGVFWNQHDYRTVAYERIFARNGNRDAAVSISD